MSRLFEANLPAMHAFTTGTPLLHIHMANICIMILLIADRVQKCNTEVAQASQSAAAAAVDGAASNAAFITGGDMQQAVVRATSPATVQQHSGQKRSFGSTAFSRLAKIAKMSPAQRQAQPDRSMPVSPDVSAPLDELQPAQDFLSGSEVPPKQLSSPHLDNPDAYSTGKAAESPPLHEDNTCVDKVNQGKACSWQHCLPAAYLLHLQHVCSVHGGSPLVVGTH